MRGHVGDTLCEEVGSLRSTSERFRELDGMAASAGESCNYATGTPCAQIATCLTLDANLQEPERCRNHMPPRALAASPPPALTTSS
jgi:hypothetical protein